MSGSGMKKIDWGSLEQPKKSCCICKTTVGVTTYRKKDYCPTHLEEVKEDERQKRANKTPTPQQIPTVLPTVIQDDRIPAIEEKVETLEKIFTTFNNLANTFKEILTNQQSIPVQPSNGEFDTRIEEMQAKLAAIEFKPDPKILTNDILWDTIKRNYNLTGFKHIITVIARRAAGDLDESNIAPLKDKRGGFTDALVKLYYLLKNAGF